MTEPRRELIQNLAEQLRRLEQSRRGPAERQRTSLGVPALDQLLPGQGIGRGTLVEWLSRGEGSGAGTLTLWAARRICQVEAEREKEPGGLVVIDPRGEFYPPAAVACGIDLARLILVQPANRSDRDWALDQSLRSAGVSAVWCWLADADNRALRRWQLAAETGGAVGLLLRPTSARDEPSFADMRLLIEAIPGREDLSSSTTPFSSLRRVRVEVLRARGTSGGGSVTLEIDDETGDVRLAAELADPTRQRRTGS